MYDSEYQKAYREQNKDYFSEYQKNYQEENKDEIRKQRKQYREANRESINEKKKEYYSDPVARKRKAERNKELYRLNPEKVKARQAARRAERLAFINEIALRYGCQNPDCKWSSEFHPTQLCFHHFDPKEKNIEVSKMESWSYPKIKDEINKCVVLCLNCHPLVHKNLIAVNENMICNE